MSRLLLAPGRPRNSAKEKKKEASPHLLYRSVKLPRAITGSATPLQELTHWSVRIAACARCPYPADRPDCCQNPSLLGNAVALDFVTAPVPPLCKPCYLA